MYNFSQALGYFVVIGEKGIFCIGQHDVSVGASLGFGYSFNELLGIYAEPGFSYYFDNGSFVETVYRERPFNFSLSLGLRFNLN